MDSCDFGPGFAVAESEANVVAAARLTAAFPGCNPASANWALHKPAVLCGAGC